MNNIPSIKDKQTQSAGILDAIAKSYAYDTARVHEEGSLIGRAVVALVRLPLSIVLRIFNTFARCSAYRAPRERYTLVYTKKADAFDCKKAGEAFLKAKNVAEKALRVAMNDLEAGSLAVTAKKSEAETQSIQAKAIKTQKAFGKVLCSTNIDVLGEFKNGLKERPFNEHAQTIEKVAHQIGDLFFEMIDAAATQFVSEADKRIQAATEKYQQAVKAHEKINDAQKKQKTQALEARNAAKSRLDENVKGKDQLMKRLIDAGLIQLETEEAVEEKPVENKTNWIRAAGTAAAALGGLGIAASTAFAWRNFPAIVTNEPKLLNNFNPINPNSAVAWGSSTAIVKDEPKLVNTFNHIDWNSAIQWAPSANVAAKIVATCLLALGVRKLVQYCNQPKRSNQVAGPAAKAADNDLKLHEKILIKA